MPTDRARRATELSQAALALEPEKQAAFLDSRCADDQALRNEVEALLAMQADARGSPALPPTETVPDATAPLPPPEAFAGYKILKELRRGGQGVVYQAVQQSTKRKVALKVLLEGPFAGAASKRRFEREIELVGSLRHPHIVPIFDSGVSQGRFYYAMEYIRGEPLAKYVEKRKLSLEDTLRLFGQVCEAVDYAHQRGVIHRDLKPSNILVDTRGEPHVLDFGLAKIGGAEATGEAESMLVSVTGQLVGTLPYMSPEQAAGRPDEVDMRSDVYALGVVLYELLTGEHPYEVVGQMADVLRNIIEVEPRRPSSIRRRINDEVETIVLKALAKEKQRRYDTAGALGRDVHRFLAGEPIDAKRDSVLYVLRKTIRRYRGPVAAAVTLFTVITVALAVSLTFWRQAAEQRDDARAARQLADDRLVDITAANKELAAEKARADKSAEDLSRRLYASLIARAEILVRDGRLTQARELLEACPQEFRHWEWDHLSWRTRPKSLLTIRGFELPLFTRDGRHIITAGWRTGPDAHNVMVWDAVTGREIHTLRGHEADVLSLALSPDGTRLLTGAGDGTLILWDAQTWLQRWKNPKVHRRRFDGLAFSPDGATIASVSFDGALKVWDAEDGELRFAKTRGYRLRNVAFSPDGSRIVSSAYAGSGGPTTVWDAATGSEVFALPDEDEATGAVALSPNGRWIVTGSMDGTLTVWDAETGAKVREQAAHTAAVRAVAFSPDGSRIASGSADTTVRLWDGATGLELAILGDHQDGVQWLSFSPEGRKVASFAWPSGGVRVWDAAAGADVLTLRGHQGIAAIGYSPGLAFSPDGRQIASTGDEGLIRIWNVASGQEVRVLQGHEAAVSDMAYHPSGGLIATGSADWTVKLWDLASGQMRTLRGHQGPVSSVAFSPDGTRLATLSVDGTLRVWDVATGKAVHTFAGHSGRTSRVTYSPKGRWIAAAHYGRTLKLWDAYTFNEARTIHRPKGKHFFGAPVFSPDGKQITCGSWTGAIKLWNPVTGQELRTLRGHPAPMGVAFGSDSRRLFLGSVDQTLSVWDPLTGEELLTLRGHEAGVRTVAVSPDGKTIATTSNDGMIKLWEAGPPLAGGYAVRQTVELARRIVDERYKRLTFASDVIASLRTDETLDAAIRKVAIEIATARGDNAYLFNEESRAVVRDPDRRAEAYRLALRKAEAACDVVPESAAYLNTLGMAWYRAGEYEDALATLLRADNIYRKLEESSHPRDVAFIAMTRHRLGHADDARKELDRLRGLMQDQRWANQVGLKGFLREAEELISGPTASGGPPNR